MSRAPGLHEREAAGHAADAARARKLRRILRPLAAVAALLALLVFLLVRGATQDLDLRPRMLAQLQLMELRDAEITRDAMLTRAGLLASYDRLAQGRANLLQAFDALASAAGSGSEEAAGELKEPLAALSSSLQDKLVEVEHFKSDDALLRTSAAYLTYTLSHISTESRTRRAMSAQVRDLTATFLKLVQAPNSQTGHQFKAALTRLSTHADADDDLRSLVSHGGLVAELLPRVVTSLQAIVEAPTAQRALEVRRRLEQISQQSERRAQFYRYSLFALALSLLAYVVWQFGHLRASASRLRESEGRLRSVAESAQDGIVSVDSAGAIVSWNPGARAIFGHVGDEVLGTPLARMIPGLALDGTASGAPVEASGRRKDGSTFPLEATCGRWRNAQGWFTTAIVRDISARRQLEETNRQQELRLVQANKLAALGTLVSGVAHEINNPNQLLLLNSSVLADTWRDAREVLDQHRDQEGDFTLAGLPYSEMREAATVLIRDLNDGARRIDRIVQDLKDFARPQRTALHSEVDVNDVVQRATRLLAHLIHKRSHRFSLVLADDVPRVRGDAQQIEQTVVNLVVNALEALPGPEREVAVSTRRRGADGWAIIEVTDEGSGIPPENLARLCDPFFTTKQDSGGTGLGLSVTFSLVQAHGGQLDFASEVGRGTRATVALPPLEPAAAAPAAASNGASPAASGTGETT